MEQSPEFKSWFGNSKVVDKYGNPLVMYHGTDAEFNEFMSDKIGSNFNLDKIGFFFTSDMDSANRSRNSYPNKPTYQFTDEDKKIANSGNILQVYLRIENPINVNSLPNFEYIGGVSATNLYDHNRELIAEALASGKYDGFILKVEGATLAIVLDSNQVKSVSNAGTFNRTSGNIYESTDKFKQFLSEIAHYDSSLIESILEAYSLLFEASNKQEWKVPHIDGKSPIITTIPPEKRNTKNLPRFANGKAKVRFQDWLCLDKLIGNSVGKSPNGKWYGWSHRA